MNPIVVKELLLILEGNTGLYDVQE